MPSFTLSDTISLSATEGTFDTIDLDVEDLTSVAGTDAIVQFPELFPTDTCNIRLAEGIHASVSTGSIAQSLTDTVSITVASALTESDSFTVTDTASITVTDAVTSNQISPQALTDTVSVSAADQLLADIGVPVTIAQEYDDTASIRIREVMSAVKLGELKIVHITFSARQDHITFTTK